MALNQDAPVVLAGAKVLRGKSWADHVLTYGRIYCRNNDGLIVCLDVRASNFARKD